jgi:hypothetical protein
MTEPSLHWIDPQRMLEANRTTCPRETRTSLGTSSYPRGYVIDLLIYHGFSFLHPCEGVTMFGLDHTTVVEYLRKICNNAQDHSARYVAHFNVPKVVYVLTLLQIVVLVSLRRGDTTDVNVSTPKRRKVLRHLLLTGTRRIFLLVRHLLFTSLGSIF